MIDSILSSIFTSQKLVLVLVAALLLAFAEIGFRFGRRPHRIDKESLRGQIGGTQGAMLGLLGLLLGFSFAMTAARYELRRDLVLQESNAIGTTYLRTSFLAEAHQEGVKDLLRRYVDVRLDFYGAGEDKLKISVAEQAAGQIQRELWTHTVAAANQSITPLTATFVSALNEVIDLDAKRMNALRSHVPGAVWLLVLPVAICACCVTGYGAGTTGARNAFTNAVLPLLIAVAITVIADLDRPRGGIIAISQQPLLDLKHSIQTGEAP